jgi:hypothetical protein
VARGEATVPETGNDLLVFARDAPGPALAEPAAVPVLRAQTVNTEQRLRAVEARLAMLGAVSFEDAIHHLRVLKRFLEACRASGCESELRVVMERARLGDLVESLLATRSA